MSELPERLRTRILPAVLTAAGVTLLAAGLLTYTTPVTAEPAPSSSASAGGPSADPLATPVPRLTLPPLASLPRPSATPTADPNRTATRVRIAALDIDMPVIKGPAGYPPCDVAMYLKELSQPGQGRATYLFAHAREGMFLPLLETSARKQNGMIVEVWTSDDQRFLYAIVEVRRDQRTLDDPLAADEEQLWLQTSEGPRGTIGKTQVIAEPLSVTSGEHDEAHPRARPRDCS
jgi:hypothetical protein